MPDILPASVREGIAAARKAPTMGEAARIYGAAFRNAGLPVPVIR